MSIATQITRLTTLRNNIRTKLISLGILSSSATSATLSDCYDGINAVTAQAATTYTPTTSNQTIASGKYLSGTQTISGDANLVAGNIKKDVSLFNVTGTFEGDTGKKQVFFIDYDGTILHSYSAAYFNNMTALPPNPTHTGLVSQGWNWTLAQIKAQLTALNDGPVWVGQMYTTSSGATEIDIELTGDRLSPTLRAAINGLHDIDWGDGNVSLNCIGTSLTANLYYSHTYSAPGSYTIKIIPKETTAQFSFYAYTTTVPLLMKSNGLGLDYQTVYSTCVKAVRIGSNVPSIADYGLAYCRSIETITIPSTVATVGLYSFHSCTTLRSATIPSGVTSVGSSGSSGGSYAFYDCSNLESVSLPSSLTSIRDDAFYNCSSLKSLTIPNGVTYIKGYAFPSCSSLENIYIPGTVTSIGNQAFQSCGSIKIAEIPNSVTSYGTNMFYECKSLRTIHLSTSATEIKTSSFEMCQCLTDITIPNGVTTLGSSAFRYCYALRNFIMPNTVTSIGAYLLEACYNLVTLVISNNVTSIPSQICSGCTALTEITIPNKVTSIGTSAFYNCTGVKKLYFTRSTPPSLGNSNVFYHLPTDCTIYVPRGYLSAYTGATNYPSSSTYTYVEWDPT